MVGAHKKTNNNYKMSLAYNPWVWRSMTLAKVNRDRRSPKLKNWGNDKRSNNADACWYWRQSSVTFSSWALSPSPLRTAMMMSSWWWWWWWCQQPSQRGRCPGRQVVVQPSRPYFDPLPATAPAGEHKDSYNVYQDANFYYTTQSMLHNSKIDLYTFQIASTFSLMVEHDECEGGPQSMMIFTLPFLHFSKYLVGQYTAGPSKYG